jgi:hypothetical protein
MTSIEDSEIKPCLASEDQQSFARSKLRRKNAVLLIIQIAGLALNLTLLILNISSVSGDKSIDFRNEVLKEFYSELDV